MRQRIKPSDKQVAVATELLNGIAIDYRRDWHSPEGRKFLSYVCELQDAGIALAWLADDIGMAQTALYSLVHRYRTNYLGQVP
jgi:hypothetical protein